MRSAEKENFEIPEKLRNKSGKLIYLSMGSMGGTDVELMKRLVSILSKSKHRFIVSKGPLHDQYELADNMWGEKTVPQIKVLSVVDLVITHGGNNTFTETFFFGKPMIVMPIFGDQYDNAQRIEEKGFGIRLNPYDFEENELLDGIDKLLNDQKLAQKLTKISKRMQSSKSIAKVAELIENLVV
jgi:UDP:flavonoid glycosyltransferase YjiC (YdhE family)